MTLGNSARQDYRVFKKPAQASLVAKHLPYVGGYEVYLPDDSLLEGDDRNATRYCRFAFSTFPIHCAIGRSVLLLPVQAPTPS